MPSQPIKWHGGKHYLVRKLLELTPPHKHRVEVFGGGMTYLLASDPQNVSEVMNDINSHLMNFWKVLQCPVGFADFSRLCSVTPFSEEQWHDAHEWFKCKPDSTRPVENAHKFFVHCRQSYAGRMMDFTALSKTRTRRGMNAEASAWLSAVDGLPEVHERLKRVVILNRSWEDVLRSEDSPHTFFYLDPPYLHETRANPEVYEYEMSETEHRALLTHLSKLQGKFLLSGYDSVLYNSFAATHGWECFKVDVPNHAAQSTTKRRMTECIWRKK
jgi:DNA adenine methylase